MAVVAGTLNKYIFTFASKTYNIFAANFEDAMVQAIAGGKNGVSGGVDLVKQDLNFQENGPTTAGTIGGTGVGTFTSLTLP